MTAKQLDIDFKSIRTFNEGRSAAFEEFCCHIARRDPDVPADSVFHRFRGAGGDGGVECIYILPTGEKWGWQAKYIFDFKRVKQTLTESITTAIRIHPELTKYFICLPFNLTGPTRRKGKSQQEKFDDYVNEWKGVAKSTGVSLDFELYGKTKLTDAFLKIDSNNGRLLYWFDKKYFSEEWFANHIEVAQKSAVPRYNPHLNIKTPIAKAFEALGRTDRWNSEVKELSIRILKIGRKWERCLKSDPSDKSTPVIPEVSRTDAVKILDKLVEIEQALIELSQLESIKDSFEWKIDALIEKTRESAAICRPVLEADLRKKHGSVAIANPGWKQFMAEFNLSFPTHNLDTLDEITTFLDSLEEWTTVSGAKLSLETAALVTGEAGIGKTHAFCDAATDRHYRGLRSILVFGDQFGDDDPLNRMRKLLELDATVSAGQLLQSLDTAAEASGSPLIIFIDALNETEPRSIWRAHLLKIVQQIRHYPMLRLCLSCRTGYLNTILPEETNIMQVEHRGFSGQEFLACREFFSAYGLGEPSEPYFQPEFANPLFLKLVCHSLFSQELSKVPYGLNGITKLITMLLEDKNQKLATSCDYHPAEKLVQKAMTIFVQTLRKKRSRSLPYIEAREIIDSILPGTWRHGPFIQILIGEDLLAIDAIPQSSGSEPVEVAYLSFERLGDHLIANEILKERSRSECMDIFKEDGDLYYAVQDPSAVFENSGLLEALSIHLAERHSLELVDCVNSTECRQALFEVFMRGLLWRDSDAINETAGQLLKEALHTRSLNQQATDTVLALSTRVGSVVNADFLHDLLGNLKMPYRDSYWCPYLHISYEPNSILHRLIHWALEIDSSNISEEVASLWILALCWCCASSDRRVRDFATKAMVKVGEAHTTIWPSIASKIDLVDDEYVVERCLAAIYGTLLRNSSTEGIRRSAEAVFDLVFEDSSKFQNLALRNNARLIMELALLREAIPEGISASCFKPPFSSDWPIEIPPVEEIAEYKDSHSELPKLYGSCFDDDFFTYIISSSVYDYEGIDALSAARWIFRHVLDMGYTKNGLSRFDRYLLGKYGGGRSRPMWAERIGKKYQWIALDRLLARLSDNLGENQEDRDSGEDNLQISFQPGRMIDPSFLLERLPAQNREDWWTSVSYNYEKVKSWSDAEWLDSHMANHRQFVEFIANPQVENLCFFSFITC